MAEPIMGPRPERPLMCSRCGDFMELHAGVWVHADAGAPCSEGGVATPHTDDITNLEGV